MLLPDDAYTVTTPWGLVSVSFLPADEEGDSPPNVFDGPPLAVRELRRFMLTRDDSNGFSIDPDTVDPHDFYWFCQDPAQGIAIERPASELAELERDAREVLADMQPGS